jgi:hypothetical protein
LVKTRLADGDDGDFSSGEKGVEEDEYKQDEDWDTTVGIQENFSSTVKYQN